MNRAEWETQRHSNEPFPPWSLATWGEQFQMLLVWLIMAIVGVGGFIGLIIIGGMMMEGAAQRSEDHDRCLKHAINGYEIKQCN